MNFEQRVEFLRRYQAHNPRKYIQKYGDVPPEIAADKLIVSPPAFGGSTTVEIKSEVPKAVEMAFTQPAPEPVAAVVEPVAEPVSKPKRKKN